MIRCRGPKHRSGMRGNTARHGDRFHRKRRLSGRRNGYLAAIEADSLGVQRADGSESLSQRWVEAHLTFDVGERRTLRSPLATACCRPMLAAKRFINGELVEVQAIQAGRFHLWPTEERPFPAGYRTFHPHGYAVTSHAARARRWMKCWSSRHRVHCLPSVRNNFTSASRVGRTSGFHR